MKIVVLDAHPILQGGVSWEPLRALGELVLHERTKPEEIETRAQQAEVVLTIRVPFNRETIRHLTALRFLGVLGSDPACVNADAARKRGILVAHTPGADSASLAQHVFALLLELTNGVGHHAHAVRNGRWCKSPDFTFQFHAIRELNGLTLGLIGGGDTAQRVARIAAGFGMRVLAHDPQSTGIEPVDCTRAPLDQVLAESDVLSLHCAHTPQTERMINLDALSRMKPESFLINTAHAALVDEDALANALRDRKLGGAALDVLSTEPPSPKNPLLRAPHCIITPHQGWGTREARQRIINEMARQLAEFKYT
ncbi:MAG TPA: NAD(P)-dependent oxidoreductase [Kiritimatiellia bacterium]|nr:NAD(P)-dependent oxidoreductase [Kiritimatiellia bacterium]